MKKIFTLLTVLVFTSSMVFAQFEKGNCFASGHSNLGLDFGKSKTKMGSTTNENYKYSEFCLDAAGGHFFIDNLMTGLFLDTYLEIYKEDDDNKDTYSQFIIGPLVRYYFLQQDKLCPYAEARLGIGSYKSKYTYAGDDNTYKETYFSTRIGGGVSYFMADNIALDAFLGYDYDAWSHKNEDEDVKSSLSDDVTKSIYSSIEFNVGIVFIINNQ